MNAPSDFEMDPAVGLTRLRGTTLYYPCSGQDIEVPLGMFGPWVDELRYVDPGYYSLRRGSSSRFRRAVAPAWRYRGGTVHGDWDNCLPGGLGPRIEELHPECSVAWRRESWEDRATGHRVVLRWECGDGHRGLGRFDAPIGVFFHRGDSGPTDNPGEGSSGSHWLSKAWLEPVLERLIDGGFVVTDGSCGREYPELSRFHDRRSMDPGVAVQEARPFETADRVFTCVGHAGMRHGPTLVWEVRRR